jgi:hypothetical protein
MVIRPIHPRTRPQDASRAVDQPFCATSRRLVRSGPRSPAIPRSPTRRRLLRALVRPAFDLGHDRARAKLPPVSVGIASRFRARVRNGPRLASARSASSLGPASGGSPSLSNVAHAKRRRLGSLRDLRMVLRDALAPMGGPLMTRASAAWIYRRRGLRPAPALQAEADHGPTTLGRMPSCSADRPPAPDNAPISSGP